MPRKPSMSITILLLSHLVASTLAETDGFFQSERTTLMEFKLNVEDPGGALSSWTSTHHCDWRGVGCNNSTGRVVKLDLRCNDSCYYGGYGLKGEIHPSLLNLEHLQYLDLSSNTFSQSSNPNFIGSFLHLTYLNLSSTGLLQTLPNRIRNSSKLQFLDLSSNYINSTIPKWLFKLTTLQHLQLARNNFHGVIPNAMEKLPNLRFLDLSENYGINGSIPNSLGMLSMLEYVDLSYNKLRGSIPLSVRMLSSLQTLDLSHNQLNRCYLLSFQKSPPLRILNLSSNKLIGNVPSFIRQLLLLQMLDISKNGFGGLIPSFIGRLSFLQILDLSENKFIGQIPESLFSLKHIRKLDFLGNAELNGTIPQALGERRKLEKLSIGGELEGVLSTKHFWNLTNLQSLQITSCNSSTFFNTSLDWIPPFRRLQILFITSCKVGPQFPMWVKTLDSLYHLNLSKAGISETLPKWFWDFSEGMKLVDISENEIAGVLPDARFAPNMNFINMKSNRLEGYGFLSTMRDMMPNLDVFSLSDNNLSGTIPSSLCDRLENFRILDLSRNQYSGGVPSCLLSKVGMQLNLANNNLDGRFSNSVPQNCSVKSIHLENNKLRGTLPLSLQNCTRTIVLDIGHNKFAGTIPVWIGERMLNLKILRLRSNMFSGNIPSQLANLNLLQVVDIANNNLAGNIPIQFGDFSTMKEALIPDQFYTDQTFYSEESILIATKGGEMPYGKTVLSFFTSIDLSNNRLSGEIPDTLGKLRDLKTLNLSGNGLTGGIPDSISRLKALETLDFSRNFLSGEIPENMSTMTSLSNLNLSFNKLSGVVPSSGQFHTFTVDSFKENSDLCGFPLQSCKGDDNLQGKDGENEDNEALCVYFSVVFGFILGFWLFCGPLLFKARWRHAYFQHLSVMNDMLYVKFYLLVRNGRHT